MSLSTVPIGENAPNTINAIVEIPARSSMKYEYDEKLDTIRLDRVLHSPMFYPVDYGFVPETRADDGDHLDVLVLMSQPAFPGCVLEVRPVGVLDMEDEEGRDWKILAVSTKDPRFKEVEKLDDVDNHLKDEIQHFFEQYKHLENKWATVKGWLDIDEAHKRIKESQERFKLEG
jgi:inorganic pyrophosphatase